ncbi:MAG: tyrosine-protein phosphatase [Ilumatobacteraceae bacterium]
MSTDHLGDAVTSPERLVALDAVHNFRDLGGYPTSSGRVTRWRTLFRADGLHRLAGADLDVVRRLGLHTVIDLRTDAEIAERGRFPGDQYPVQFHHLSVLDHTWDIETTPVYDDDADFLHWAYTEMLDQGGDAFAAAIEALAVPGALPAVFHCAAGKDRTGILAMLVLGAVGVSEAQITADYALTAGGIERMRVWAAREMPDAAQRWAETPSAFFAAVPEAMVRVLADVDAQYGDVRSYVRHLGVGESTLVELEHGLLEPQ